MKQIRYILGLVLLVINYGCAPLQQDKGNSEIHASEKVANQLTSDNLRGDWSCYKIFVDYRKADIYLDIVDIWLPGSGNLVFKEDSMWYFDYPREFHASYIFKLDSNKLMIKQDGKQTWELNKLELNGDSLVRTIETSNKIIYTEYYVRDTLEKETIQVLLRDSVNKMELVGTWFLESSIATREGDIFELDFPFELPDSLMFSNESLLSSIIKGRIIRINIEGISREFRFGFMKEDEYSYQKIWLRPTDWYDGEELRIHYY